MGILAFCIQQIVALWTGHAAPRGGDTVSPKHYWMTFFFLVTCTPLVEEWISRKVVIDFSLKRNVPAVYALLASASLFSAGHLLRLSSADAILKTAVLAGAFVDGVVLAAIYLKTRKLIYPVIAHAVINAFLFAPKAMLEANVNSQNSVFDYVPFVALAIVLLSSLTFFAWAILLTQKEKPDRAQVHHV